MLSFYFHFINFFLISIYYAVFAELVPNEKSSLFLTNEPTSLQLNNDVLATDPRNDFLCRH